MDKDKTLLFHNKIIKTGKRESKFAIRYNLGFLSPFMRTQWDYNAKSVSCPIEDNSENKGIYCVPLNVFFKTFNYNFYVKKMTTPTWEPLKIILLEYTEDDVLFKSEIEISLKQCNIVYVCDNIVSIYRIFKDITNKFQKIKEAAEYNTYY